MDSSVLKGEDFKNELTIRNIDFIVPSIEYSVVQIIGHFIGKSINHSIAQTTEQSTVQTMEYSIV